MADTPFVLIIGTIKMLAQVGSTEKIVELCNEWLDVFESRPTTGAVDGAKLCPECDSEIAVCMMGHYCGEVAPRH